MDALTDLGAFPTTSGGQNRQFRFRPEACGKGSAARFREVGETL
jgi:hypothetical protein